MFSNVNVLSLMAAITATGSKRIGVSRSQSSYRFCTCQVSGVRAEKIASRCFASSFKVAVTSSGITVSGKPDRNAACAAGMSVSMFHSGSGFGLPS